MVLKERKLRPCRHVHPNLASGQIECEQCGLMIGLITAVRLTSMAAQVPGAFLAEASGSRKKVWAALALLQRGLWIVPAIVAVSADKNFVWIPAVVFAAVALSELFGNASCAPWLSWMTDLIPGRSSGKFWGARQSVRTAASLGGLWLAGFLLDAYDGRRSGGLDGFGIVFFMGTIFGLLDVLFHRWVPEPANTVARVLKGAQWHGILAPLKNAAFRKLTLSIGLWSFGFSMIGTFGIVYLKKAFGLSYSELASLTVAGGIGSIVSGYYLGQLIDRIGARVSACLLLLTSPLCMVGYFFIGYGVFEIFGTRISSVTAVAFVCSVAGGALFSGVALCQIRLMGLLSEPSGRTMWMAMHACLIGLLSALGPIIGGMVMDWFDNHPSNWLLIGGVPFSFYHAQILIFLVVALAVALPVLLSIRVPHNEMPFTDAVSEMLLTNPLQVVRNFQNIGMMNYGATKRERIGATRRLGGTRTRLAIPDLVSKLEDPSLDLQEEAVEALGNIGTEEAVEALILKLRDPSNLVAAKICRALRQAANPRAVEVLISKLDIGEPETVIEGVRALGEIGDRRAIPFVLDLMKETRDHKLLAVCGEALAALGELSAAYQIIPQMRETDSRALKRALALAVGDLLGEREKYYRLLILESESHGAGVMQVLGRLSRAVKRRFPSAKAQIDSIFELESAYESSNVPACADILLHLGLHLIQFLHGLQLTLDPDKAIHNLMDCSRQSTIALWFLKILAEPWTVGGVDTRDLPGILLGIHILTSLMEADSRSFDSPAPGVSPSHRSQTNSGAPGRCET